MVANGLRELAGDLLVVMPGFGNAMQNVFQVPCKAPGLGNHPAGQGARWHDALQRLCVLGADQPDPVPGDELDVVAAAAENTGILVRAADPARPWFTRSRTFS